MRGGGGSGGSGGKWGERKNNTTRRSIYTRTHLTLNDLLVYTSTDAPFWHDVKEKYD